MLYFSFVLRMPMMSKEVLMASSSFADISGTRCRFQRLSDAKFFNGWILSLTEKAAQVTVCTDIELGVGQSFMFEGVTKKNRVTFEGVLAGVGKMDESASYRVTNLPGTNFQLMEAQKALYVFKVTSEVRFAPSSEAVRIKVDDMAVDIEWEGESFRCVAVDIADKGVGVVMPEPIQKGESVEVTLDTMFGPVGAVCKVCYCQPCKERIGWYRAGLMFTEIQRLNAQRWRHLMEKAA